VSEEPESQLFGRPTHLAVLLCLPCSHKLLFFSALLQYCSARMLSH
jgi:hypothetical protein